MSREQHKDPDPGQRPPAQPDPDAPEAGALQQLEEAIDTRLNIGGLIAKTFIDSKTTLLVMVAALLFGLFALFVTPREENPQISVPAVNVIIPFPGASPQEIEKLVAAPMERRIWNIKGVEHVYSISYPDFAVVTAQFLVGQKQEESVFKVYNQVYSNLDALPSGVQQPLIKPVDINEVPILAITLYSAQRSSFELRSAAEELVAGLREVPGTSASVIVGGETRQITVELDPVKAAAYAIDPQVIAQALEGANMRLPSDRLEHGSERILIRSGQFLRNAEDVGSVVLSTRPSPAGPGGQPVYLRDLARVSDGPAERSNVSRISFGPGMGHSAHDKGGGSALPEDSGLAGRSFNAVTLAISKQQGTNAVKISEALISKMEQLAPQLLPQDTAWLVTRDDGEGANHAVNELVTHLTWAIVIVLGLLVVALGWRDAAVVALAIPLTLLVTLGVGLLAGQTINRITLFALILSLGLLVDDAIVVVENIHRRLKSRPPGEGIARTCIMAVNEISSPTIYATLTVIVSMIPMAFVTGMMGPYMGPIPFNVPVAMIVSLLVAFKVTPYLALRWLRVHSDATQKDGHAEGAGTDFAAEHGADQRLLGFYRRTLQPLMDSPARRALLFSVLVIALLASFTLPLFQLVKFRMLPKANKNTFLVTVDMPAGSSLNATEQLSSEIEAELLKLPQLKALITTVGTGSVVDFNGLLRGTAFRNDPAQADIRVNLTAKEERSISSEEIVLRLRPRLAELAQKYRAIVKLVEDPPGPPVRATLVAEIYGPYGQQQRDAVARVRGMFAETAEVVDIDDSVSTVARQLQIEVDRERAQRAGLSVRDVSMSLYAALAGYRMTVLHDPAERVQTPVVLRFPPAYRSQASDLDNVVLPSPAGPVPLSALTRRVEGEAQRPIYHKDLQAISYVYGEMGRRSSVYAVIELMGRLAQDPLSPGYQLKWEGEWDLTLKVFRDLGIAMGVAIVLIYLLLVGRFHSFVDPMVILGAVPLTMLGILPGFAVLGGFDIYFSATGMIGVIALAGIVVRNSIILIEFIKDAQAAGVPLREAVILAGAIRTRPIILTAIAAIAGMLVVVTDPVWSGLSWALLFGIVASTSLSLIVIPLMYYMAKSRQEGAAN
ncbi:efflux RND transporter permease subunit [bacterium]|nr:efflux RND transporter permease subunit [bacterium]